MSTKSDEIKSDSVDATILLKVENLGTESEPEKSNLPKIIGGGILVIAVLFLFPFLGSWFFRSTQSAPSSTENLEVSQLIRNLKQQLIEASEEAGIKGEQSFLELQNVELEINYVVKTGNNTSGSAKFYVITADNSSKTDLEKSQKIKLTLKVNKELKTKIPTPPGNTGSIDDGTVFQGSTPTPKKK